MRYVIGDPSLKHLSGHCFAYINAIAGYLRAQGDEVVVVGNRDIDLAVQNAANAIAGFTFWCDARPVPSGLTADSAEGRDAVRVAHENAMCNDLAAIDMQVGFKQSDTLVLNTLRHWPMRGVVRWLETLPPERAPRIVIILHFTSYPDAERDDGTAAMYRAAFESIQRSPAADRFILLADSDELVAEYKTLTALPIQVAPIPHCHTASVNHDDETELPNHLVVTYPGEARENKGFHLLPRLADALNALGLSNRVTLAIQTFTFNPHSLFYMRVMAGLHHRNLRLLPDQLTEDEYRELLDGSHVVLLPYRLDNYHSQTSGIFAEAVSQGKPVVTTRGTWMARQARRYSCGSLVSPDDPLDFIRGVVDVIRNYPAYRAAALLAAKRWNVEHTPSKLVSLFGNGR
jgi:hypothetical protein